MSCGPRLMKTNRIMNIMTCSSESSKHVYQGVNYGEVVRHNRRKTRMIQTIKNINIQNYKDLSFKQIYTKVSDLCKSNEGYGKLAAYDITSAICKYHHVTIDKIFINGSGPELASIILQLKPKKMKINGNTLLYIEIKDVLEAFKKNKIKYAKQLENSNDGDLFETYLCIWQKIHIYNQVLQET